MPLAHSPQNGLSLQDSPESIGSCMLCVVTTDCGHVFHIDCIQNYLRETPMPGPSITVAAEDVRVHNTRYLSNPEEVQ